MDINFLSKLVYKFADAILFIYKYECMGLDLKDVQEAQVLRSLVGMLWGGYGWVQECPYFGPGKESVEHVLFECSSYD